MDGGARLDRAGGEGADAAALKDLARAEPDREAERTRERRLSDEEYQAFLARRTEDQRRARTLVHQPLDEDARRRSDAFRSREARLDADAAGRAPVRQALAGLDRAAELLRAGQGAEASLVLSREANDARRAARELDRSDPAWAVLSVLATQLAVRGDGLETAAPAEARRIAERLERTALATDRRAASVGPASPPGDAALLRALAADARGQSALFRAAADNTDALLGRSLSRVLQEMTSAVLVARAAPEEEQRRTSAAFRALDRAIDEGRQPLHEVLEPPEPVTPPRSFTGRAPSRPKSAGMDVREAAELLRASPLTEPLVSAFSELSRGLSDADAKALNRARTELLRRLQRESHLSFVEQWLQRGEPTRATTAAELRDRELPKKLAAAIFAGGLGTFVNDSRSIGVGARLGDVRAGLPEHAPALLPAEKILADLRLGRAGRWEAAALGAFDAVLLGSGSLFRASGTLTAFLRLHPPPELPLPRAFLADGDPSGFFALPPTAREQLVLVDPHGAVMVRAEGLPEWHHAWVEPAGERWYVDVEGDQSLWTVRYTSAEDPERSCARLELPVGRGADPADLLVASGALPVRLPRAEAEPPEVVGDDAETREIEILPKRRRRTSPASSAFDDLALIAVVPGSGGGRGVLGFVSRLAARRASDELERMAERSGGALAFEHVLVEHASDVVSRLERLGLDAPMTAALEEDIAARLAAQELDADRVGALVLLAFGEDAAAAGVGVIESVLPDSGLARPPSARADTVRGGAGEPAALARDPSTKPRRASSSAMKKRPSSRPRASAAVFVSGADGAVERVPVEGSHLGDARLLGDGVVLHVVTD